MAKKGTVDTEGAAREQARGNHEDRLYAPVKSRHLYGGQRTVSYGRTEALTIKNPRTSAAE